jgi:hypothetical protein
MIRKIGAAIAAIVLATSSGVAADQTSPTYQNAMHGTWIADLKSTGPQGGALQSVLVFQGDEYKLELRSGLTGLTRLTVVGHFTAETEAGDATRVRVTFNPVRWQPTQSCQAGACRDIGPIPPNATEFTVDDHDTIQDDAGEIYHRRVKHRVQIPDMAPPDTAPTEMPPNVAPPTTPIGGMPDLGMPGMPGIRPGAAMPGYVEQKKRCLPQFAASANFAICQIDPPPNGCDPISGYGRGTEAYREYCICMGNPNGECS